MYRADAAQLDAGHPRDLAVTGGVGEATRLEHRHCSRSAGAKLGNQLRAGTYAPPPEPDAVPCWTDEQVAAWEAAGGSGAALKHGQEGKPWTGKGPPPRPGGWRLSDGGFAADVP
jgi:hypothetical protein